MSLILIAAASYSPKTGLLGIGFEGKMPWNVPEDLKYFKNTTKGKVVVMGRKTFESIGSKPLPDRVNIVLSRTLPPVSESELVIVNSVWCLNEEIHSYTSQGKDVYIIGGEELYNQYLPHTNKILLTHIHKEYTCDTFFPELDTQWEISKYSKDTKCTFLEYTKKPNNINQVDVAYRNLLHKVLCNGNVRQDRTNTGTISLFGEQLKIDICQDCPLLTGKKVAWKTCIIELLWFLRGETDANILKKQNVHIWDGNTTREFLDKRGLDYPEGELGPGYGWQIRRSGANYPNKEGGIDQLATIEHLLKTDPFSRRIMWNLYVPEDLDKMALVPCHYSFQLYVTVENNQKYLSGLVNLRSNDLFLGNPFNIFCYYTLIRILALRCDMKPKELILNIGDAHIYSNHVPQANEFMTRSYKAQPILELDESIKDKAWEDICIQDFSVIGYFPHPNISAPMAV